MKWLPLVAAATLLIGIAAVFWVAQGSPGDPSDMVAAEVASPERVPARATATAVPSPTPGIVTPAGSTQAPEFRGIVRWLNSEPLTLEEQRGKVVLIDFWTYS